MNTVNAYEKLYNQMKNSLAVVTKDNKEYILGDYMLMKAGAKNSTSNLPVAKPASANSTAITTFFKYINDKLTVKTPPAEDKTIRRFPLRTACAALFSAIVASTLLFSYGQISMQSVSSEPSATVETVEDENTTQVQK